MAAAERVTVAQQQRPGRQGHPAAVGTAHAALPFVVAVVPLVYAGESRVVLQKTPGQGIQPQAVADANFDTTGWTPPGHKAPPPAAVLLQAEDISSYSGLDPAGIETMLNDEPLFGEGPPGPKIVYAKPGFS